MMTLGNMRSKMRRVLLGMSLAAVAGNSPNIAQQDCGVEAPRRWYTNEMVCAALLSAYAQRIDMNVGQQARVEMLRSRADYPLRAALRHAREIGDDPAVVQNRHENMYSAYLDDEAKMLSEIKGLSETCHNSLKLEMLLSPAQLQSLLCTSRY
jgi:hypothetical protein